MSPDNDKHSESEHKQLVESHLAFMNTLDKQENKKDEPLSQGNINDLNEAISNQSEINQVTE